MKIENALGIPSAHPALAGHFPGNPIVPGVVLLDEVIHAAQAYYDKEIILAGIPNVKFLAPLLPSVPFYIEFTENGNCVKFTCTSGDVVIASGQLDLL